VCSPACGQWFKVGSDPSVGVIFLNDQVQENGAVTTNQLDLGGKTFTAGRFMDLPTALPAKAITGSV
jgi:hypothetical protein